MKIKLKEENSVLEFMRILYRMKSLEEAEENNGRSTEAS